MDNLQERFGNEKLKVGETDGGRTVYMSIEEYMAYLERDAPSDDSPLYIFDSLFADLRHRNTADKMRREAIMDELYEEDHSSSKKSKKRRRIDLPQESAVQVKAKKKESLEPLCAMLLDYQPPYYFSLDLFSFAGESSRPPHRWIVIGPKRAGTYIHTDPLGTSAWNALLTGKKRYHLPLNYPQNYVLIQNRWALFPPGTPKHLIDPPRGLPDREAVTWFSRVYPTLNKKDTGMVEIIQHPGETVFVPGGWAHVVMNLDLSLAITQNFCSPSGLERCFLKARTSRPKFTQKWVRKLPEKWRSKLDVLAQVPLLPLGSSSSSPSSTSSDSDSESDA
jgi:histone arginine demethylase JMJD6